MINFCKAIAQQLPINTNNYLIGAVSFGNEATLHMKLGQYNYLDGVTNNLGSIPWKDQWTNTSGGLWLMRTSVFSDQNGDRPYAPNIAILITDGVSNKDKIRTVPEAEKARSSGITIIALGVGNEVDQLELSGIASDPTYLNRYTVTSFDNLQNIVDAIIQRICDNAGRIAAFLSTGSLCFSWIFDI